jgi:hypothetical protein
MPTPTRSAAAVLALYGLVVAQPADAVEGSAAGVRWTAPKEWTIQAVRPMRVATYAIPAAKGSAAGECAVYYFGRGQGGGVDENLSRWTRQFEDAAPARRARRTVRAMTVFTLDVSGTYLAPGGPMMESRGKLPNYRLLGAIVETPEGLVFFKATGPAPTMERARADFDRMIESIAKTGATV